MAIEMKLSEAVVAAQKENETHEYDLPNGEILKIFPTDTFEAALSRYQELMNKPHELGAYWAAMKQQMDYRTQWGISTGDG
jgi:hypothetical protein